MDVINHCLIVAHAAIVRYRSRAGPMVAAGLPSEYDCRQWKEK
jgi:hypothetical protein